MAVISPRLPQPCPFAAHLAQLAHEQEGPHFAVGELAGRLRNWVSARLPGLRRK